MKSVKEYWQQTSDWYKNFQMKYRIGSCLPAGAALMAGSAIVFGAFLAAAPLSAIAIPFAMTSVFTGFIGASMAAIGAVALPFEKARNNDIKIKTNAAGQKVRGTARALNMLEQAQTKINRLTAPFNLSAALPKSLEQKIDAIIAKVSDVRNSVTVTDAGASGNADTYQFVRMKTETLNR